MDDPTATATTVGGWTQAYCTTCRTMREHVVVAMVGGIPAKVECTSCHRQHLYRAEPPGEKKPKEKAVRSTTSRLRKAASLEPAVPAIDVAARVAGRTPQGYDPQRRYVVDDVIQHPSFGVGVVTALPGAQKVEVTFEVGAKLLSHDRGAQKAGLMRPPPRDEDSGPRVSDAPPPKR